MFRFEKQNCPVCDIPFTENDDIVVCPDCGTPHHRNCYIKEGKCANVLKHADGFLYENIIPEIEIEPDTIQGELRTKDINEAKDVKPDVNICKECNTPNSVGALFCEKCGRVIGKTEYTSPSENKENPMGDVAIQSFFDAGFMKEDEEFEGIKAKDWAMYIGGAAPYYLLNFKKQDERPKNSMSFTLSALFMPAFYFLYRRMWIIALLIVFIQTLLQIPSSIILLSNMIELDFNMELMNDLSFYCQTANSILHVLSAFFAVTLFRKYTARKLKKLRIKNPDDESYNKVLKKLSGPSRFAFSLVLVYIIFLTVIIMLL